MSISAAAALLAQYVSFNVAHGGLGEPGPLQYLLSTHTLERVAARTRPTCPVEATTADGDAALPLTGPHPAAEQRRAARRAAQSAWSVRLGRTADATLHRMRTRLRAIAARQLKERDGPVPARVDRFKRLTGHVLMEP